MKINKMVCLTLVENTENFSAFFEGSHVYFGSLFYTLLNKESNIL